MMQDWVNRLENGEELDPEWKAKIEWYDIIGRHMDPEHDRSSHLIVEAFAARTARGDLPTDDEMSVMRARLQKDGISEHTAKLVSDDVVRSIRRKEIL